MKFENLQKADSKKFRRITGVKRGTFNAMLQVIKEFKEKRKKEQAKPGGRPPKLSIENRLLMMLEYLSEYRSYANIGVSYGLSETRTYENIKLFEEILIKSGKFSLPGKKALLKSENEYTVVLVDVTETPIERPKKNSGNFTQVKRRDIQ